MGGRHQYKDKTESAAAGQRHDEVILQPVVNTFPDPARCRDAHCITHVVYKSSKGRACTRMRAVCWQGLSMQALAV